MDYNSIRRLMELDDIAFIMETSIDRAKFKENLLQHDNQTHDKFKVFHRKGGVLVEDI